MFTGLVQAVGEIEAAAPDGHGGRRLRVREPLLSPLLELGESVAVGGVCLTVVAAAGGAFDFEVGPETVARTVLGRLGPGAAVNLERSLRVGDRIGGHFVSGHVDAVGAVARREPSGGWETIWVEFPPAFRPLLVEKGSVAIDGVSLTVVAVDAARFSVMLIPHTLAHTTLGRTTAGSPVNLEFDQLAKYVLNAVRNFPPLGPPAEPPP